MKKLNDHAEPTKVESSKKSSFVKRGCAYKNYEKTVRQTYKVIPIYLP